jgi:3-deoxy-D-manno-octulosonate 8-phosphate phosphatase KdsC-like HAD superfamily phosphatase
MLCVPTRLTKTPNKSEEQLQAAVAARPACLATSTNLGIADFYPKASGKEGAAAYLMEKFGVPASRCALLCDDDNDLELAAIVGKAFLPSIGAVSLDASMQCSHKQQHDLESTTQGTACMAVWSG